VIVTEHWTWSRACTNELAQRIGPGRWASLHRHRPAAHTTHAQASRNAPAVICCAHRVRGDRRTRPTREQVEHIEQLEIGKRRNRIHIGTAGWSIPRASAHNFATAGSHLERYSHVLTCAEINSSFHRPHLAATYARWASSTPPQFRFAVKVPRTITHDQKLRRTAPLLERFLEDTEGLGQKRGPLLVQLPPSLAFDPRVAARFFDLVRSRYEGFVVCEPRHPTWLSPQADALLVRHEVARVAADPPPVTRAELPGGWKGIVYYRLHGAPRKYWSRYDGDAIATLGNALRSIPPPAEAWCVFDNTASGAALENAWELHANLLRST
jgi:uncharacterized protein YecE (DUF72 family)